MMPLLPHQKRGVKYILSHSSAFVCDDMGMGKTRTVIEAVFERGKFPILIVCPASLKLNWANEIKQWKGIDVKIDDPTQRVIVTNFERMKKFNSKIKGVKQLVLDECHAFKNKKSKRTQLALEWAKQIPYKVLMTGTPMLNRPNELVAQLLILGILDSKFGSEQKFLSEYCSPRNSQYRVDYSGSSNLTKLHNKMKKIWLRRTKKDLSNQLPSKQIVPIAVTELRQPAPHSFSEIEHYDRTCLQKKLTSSIEFIKQLLERGEKVVVFVHHKSVGKSINLAFPTASVIVGGQSPSIRQKNVNNFQLGDSQLIICSLMASAVGLTLTAARIAVFIEYPWSPTLLRQAQDRVHRIGQDRPVTIYYLYAKDSIDEYRLNINGFKNTIIDFIVEEKK